MNRAANEWVAARDPSLSILIKRGPKFIAQALAKWVNSKRSKFSYIPACKAHFDRKLGVLVVELPRALLCVINRAVLSVGQADPK